MSETVKLPPLPEAKVMVREPDEESRSLENGGWIVDCDCEGPLSYSLEGGDALYTADQMREYARAALASAPAGEPIPEGWQMVPKTLTPEMANADPYGLGYGRLDAIWSRLLRAAPPLR
jgi:hypothetical protein